MRTSSAIEQPTNSNIGGLRGRMALGYTGIVTTTWVPMGAGGGKLCDETENQNMRNYAKNMRKYAKNMQQNMRSFFLANS